MDYIYTAFHQSHKDGTPLLHPVWFKYPKDVNTFGIDLQFFYGDSILVSPVTQEGATSVSIYLPKDIFYDFVTLSPVQGTGSTVTLSNITLTQIPVHIKGGAVLPLRAKSAMTTTQLRKTDFEFVVAPDLHDEASGNLYVDDGESITQKSTTEVSMKYKSGTLAVTGQFGYALGVNVSRVRFLGVKKSPKAVMANGKAVLASGYSYDSTSKVLDVTIGQPFTKGLTVQYL